MAKRRPNDAPPRPARGATVNTMSKIHTPKKAGGLRAEVPTEFVNARLRGRRSRMYEGERLYELARVQHWNELALELYPGRDFRDQFDLERHMVAQCAGELASFLPYLGGRVHALYGALLRTFTVENLKVLWRLFASNDRSGAEDLLIELPDSLALRRSELLSAVRPTAFVERIPLPYVRDAAWQALPLYQESSKTAVLEMAFDKGYWTDVQEALAGFSRGARKKCAAPVELEFDTLRLVAVLRAARVYDLEWNTTRRLLPEGEGGMSMGALQQLHEDPSAENVADLVGWLRPISPTLEALEDTTRVEDLLWHRAVRLANRQYYASMEGPAALIAYYYLKREELRHLLSLTQMLRLNRPAEEIVQFLER